MMHGIRCSKGSSYVCRIWVWKSVPALFALEETTLTLVIEDTLVWSRETSQKAVVIIGAGDDGNSD